MSQIPVNCHCYFVIQCKVHNCEIICNGLINDLFFTLSAMIWSNLYWQMKWYRNHFALICFIWHFYTMEYPLKLCLSLYISKVVYMHACLKGDHLTCRTPIGHVLWWIQAMPTWLSTYSLVRSTCVCCIHSIYIILYIWLFALLLPSCHLLWSVHYLGKATT